MRKHDISTAVTISDFETSESLAFMSTVIRADRRIGRGSGINNHSPRLRINPLITSQLTVGPQAIPPSENVRKLAALEHEVIQKAGSEVV